VVFLDFFSQADHFVPKFCPLVNVKTYLAQKTFSVHPFLNLDIQMETFVQKPASSRAFIQ
jgi:hypothetical protein